jgi:hypothetical protein
MVHQESRLGKTSGPTTPVILSWCRALFSPRIVREPRPTKYLAYLPLDPAARKRPDPLSPGYAILALYPGSNYPVRILGKFVYLIQGQPEMICH